MGGSFMASDRTRLRSFRKLLRPFRGLLDRRRIRAYFAHHAVGKLHIGSGTYHEEGWLNSDLEPVSLRDISLDATRPFPFSAGSFDFIYSEHMIEHVPYAAGRSMLAECLRVLKPGGVLRIATPRLEFLLDLCRADRTPLQEAYIRWARETFVPDTSAPRPVFVVNNFVRAWGHQFLYDEETLVEAMCQTGFHCVTVCELGESSHSALSGLEHEARLPAGFMRLETMVVEGTKPMAPD
jgi:predicted SAM-dependent methyltransferase